MGRQTAEKALISCLGVSARAAEQAQSTICMQDRAANFGETTAQGCASKVGRVAVKEFGRPSGVGRGGLLLLHLVGRLLMPPGV